MKKYLSLMIASELLIASVNAAVLTVNNSASGGAQYAQINAAVAAANAGDTLYVSGSLTTYSSATLTKALTLIGPGTFNQSPFALPAAISSISLTANSSNTSIIGFKITAGSIGLPQNISNITISNCNIASSAINIPDLACSNILIRNNIFSGGNSSITYGSTSGGGSTFNIMIEHNIFNGFINGLTSLNAVVQNNIFYNSSPNGNPFAFFNACANLVVKNNIFFNSNPTTNITNSIFNNNITYNTGTTYTPLGGTNLDNVNPLFVNVPSSGNYTSSLNFHLQSGSPGLNAGSDGKDIGFYGGLEFVSSSGEFVNMPYLRKMEIENSSVPLNGNVNVKVRSTKSK